MTTVLRPAPEGCHEDCENGCSHALRSIAGPCSQQCVKTEAFHDRSSAEARANRFRFIQSIGLNPLHDVKDKE